MDGARVSFDSALFPLVSVAVSGAGAALRLARFNRQVETADNRFFTGLARPAAAAVIAGTVWAGFDVKVEAGVFAGLLAALTGLSGILMVTNLRYCSFKGIDFKIENQTLTCLPNYFMPFDNIRFVKE